MHDRRKEKYKPIYKLFIQFYPLTIEDLPNEIWKPIPAYEDYHCSNYGRVKSFKWNKPKIKTPVLGGGGYLSVGLSKNGKEKHFRINRLVAMLFIPNPDNKPEVNHVRGRFNNYVGWLEWATSSENTQHAYDTGLAPSGADVHNAKLSPAQVMEIRDNPEGLTTYELAEIYGVTTVTIGEIQRGEKWKHVGGQIRTEHACRKLNEAQRNEIRQRYSQGGTTQRELAAEYGVTQAAIWNIIHEEK